MVTFLFFGILFFVEKFFLQLNKNNTNKNLNMVIFCQIVFLKKKDSKNSIKDKLSKEASKDVKILITGERPIEKNWISIF